MMPMFAYEGVSYGYDLHLRQQQDSSHVDIHHRDIGIAALWLE